MMCYILTSTNHTQCPSNYTFCRKLEAGQNINIFNTYVHLAYAISAVISRCGFCGHFADWGFLPNTPWICREVKSCIASGKRSQFHGLRTVITVQFTTVKPAQLANKGRRRLFTPERRRKSGSGSRLPTDSYRENFKVNIDELSRFRSIEDWIYCTFF